MPTHSTPIRWSVASAVLITHVMALASLMNWSTRSARVLDDAKVTPAAISAFIIDEQRAGGSVPIAEVVLDTPKIDFNGITQIQFESAEWGDISGVVAPASAPQLSRFQPVRVETFARRARLPAGQVASIVLTVEVLPDGTVGAIEITRGSKNPLADAAAVAYARRLRWIPGTDNHHAEAMRVQLPVTLAWNA